MDKEEKNIIVDDEGNKNEEGRLQIEKIEKYKEESEDFKINAVLFGIIGAFEILFGLVGFKMSYKEILLLTPTAIMPFILSIFMKHNTDKKVYNLEEELANPKEKLR